MIRLSHIEKTYFGKGNETHALKNVNFDTYNSLTPNWYYKVLR